MCSNANGKIFGCLPVWAVIVAIALTTALLEFIWFTLEFYVSSAFVTAQAGIFKDIIQKQFQLQTIPDPPYFTAVFVFYTFNFDVHCFLVCCNFALMMAACLKLPVLVTVYASGAATMVVASLCQIAEAIAKIIFLAELEETTTYKHGTRVELAVVAGQRFEMPSPSTQEPASMHPKMLTVLIVAILWNLFASALYGFFAALAVMCARSMSNTTASSPAFKLPFQLSRSNPDSQPPTTQQQAPMTDLSTPQSTAPSASG